MNHRACSEVIQIEMNLLQSMKYLFSALSQHLRTSVIQSFFENEEDLF